jgi:salicylate hydroxylase
MGAPLVIAGGGMAGLGAALALSRARPRDNVLLLEQSSMFAEVGAGIQLGPNAVRVLRDWGLEGPLRDCAAFPDALRVRDARSGHELGFRPLGPSAETAYGAPYATIHRADLHELLLEAALATGQVSTLLNRRVSTFAIEGEQVQVTDSTGETTTACALLGCDGLWSLVRAQMLGDGRPAYSGHLAYRGMVPMADFAPGFRGNEVVAWLGPRMHAVHYPVRGGDWMNVVAVVHGPIPTADHGWDHEAHAADLQAALGTVAPDLQAVLDRVLHWRLWPLNGRPAVQGPAEMAQGRVALLGDAAHPMRPYLAQGAAMALEDAWTLGQQLHHTPPGADPDWPAVLSHWASIRWARNAWVQRRSQRNGTVFHARGALRWGRNVAMKALGGRLLDVPRLYSGPPPP